MAQPTLNVDTKVTTANTHETTPLPQRQRGSVKKPPTSPQAILDGYMAARNDGDLFAIAEHQHPNDDDDNNNTHNTLTAIETDPKRTEARKSYNYTMNELKAAAVRQKNQQAMEMKEDNDSDSSSTHSSSPNTGSSSSSSTTSSIHDNIEHGEQGANAVVVTSVSSPQDLGHRHSERPYFDEGDDNDSEDSLPENMNMRGQRYSTFMNKYRMKEVDEEPGQQTTNTQPPQKPEAEAEEEDDDDGKQDRLQPNNTESQPATKTSRVHFAADLPDSNEKKKKGVTFQLPVDTGNDAEAASRAEEKKEEEDNGSGSDVSSTLSSQESENLLEDLLNAKLNVDDDQLNDELSSPGLNGNQGIGKSRKSKFLAFGTVNFLQSALPNLMTRHQPKTPLPNLADHELEMEFSETASTVDLNEYLWKPVSDRSDSSDDSDSKTGTKRKSKRVRKKRTKRSKHMEDGHGREFDEEEKRKEIEKLQQKLIQGDSGDDDSDEFDYDDDAGFDALDSTDTDDSVDDDNNEFDTNSMHGFKPYTNGKQKGDRMWFRHHMGHLKVLKKFFREMDKDGDGTISYDEFTKFLAKYKLNKRFKAEEIERFFLKITDIKFDPDNPNAAEEKMNMISPTLELHTKQQQETAARSNSSLKDAGPRTSQRGRGTTSFFFRSNKTAPTGEVDMATFLFYFSSPIDSQAMNQHHMMGHINENEPTLDTQRDTLVSTEINVDDVLSPDLYGNDMEDNHHNGGHHEQKNSILPDTVTKNQWNVPFSKAAGAAAAKARHKGKGSKGKRSSSSSRNKSALSPNVASGPPVDNRIDPSLLKTANRAAAKKRASLQVTSSRGKKLKQRTNKNEGKRGSISALMSYHHQQRLSRNHGSVRTSDDLDISKMSKWNEMYNKRGSRTVPRQEDVTKMTELQGLSLTNASSIINNRNSQSKKSREAENIISPSMSQQTSINSPLSAEDDHLFVKKFESVQEIEKLMKNMRKNIQVQDRKTWQNCFIGRDAVTYFLSRDYVNSRHGGLLLGRKLVQRGYIKYAGDEERDFEDEIRFFYQFTDKENRQKDTIVEIANEEESDYNVKPTPSPQLDSHPVLGAADSYLGGVDAEMNELLAPSMNIEDSKSRTHSRSNSQTASNIQAHIELQSYDTGTTNTPVPASTNHHAAIPSLVNIPPAIMEFTYSTAHLTAMVANMKNTIQRTSYRSNTLSSSTEDIFSGKEIVNWLMANKYAKDRTEATNFGTYLRGQGFIRHIEYVPVFKDADDEFYTVAETVALKDDDSFNNNTNPGFSYNDSSNSGLNSLRAAITDRSVTMAIPERNANKPSILLNGGTTGRSTRRKNDSVASNLTYASEFKSIHPTANVNPQQTDQRQSLVLGQMGKGSKTRSKKREKLVQDLFTFIIRSQIKEATLNMSADSLLAQDMIIDGAENKHVRKLLDKIQAKFKKCDENNRDSLSKQEFNRFLMKCGVILHQQDLNVIFRIFDKNNTGLVDYTNFVNNSLVHRVPGIKTENLSITHLIKHTISVNFGVSGGKKGAEDQYTKITTAISEAFEEINTSHTGAITLDEFKLAYRKHNIEVYGGVTQIFHRLSKNGQTVRLEDFTEAFQGNIFENRTEPPTLKDILNKLGIIQWTLSPTNDDEDDTLLDADNAFDDNDDSVNTLQSNGTQTGMNPRRAGELGSNLFPPTTGSMPGITPTDTPNALQSTADHNIIGQRPTNHLSSSDARKPGGYMLASPTGSVEEDHDHEGRTQLDIGSMHESGREGLIGLSIVPPDDGMMTPIDTRDTGRSYDDAKSPRTVVELKWRECVHRVFHSFALSTIVVAFPGVILNSLLHFLQAIPWSNNTFPLVDFTWYVFGFLVYLALQSTMVGWNVTKSLLVFYVIVAGVMGAILVIATILGYVLDFGSFNNLSLIWWCGLFLVYLICETAARSKFRQLVGQQRTKREDLWYAVSHAIGVTLFWFAQTFISLIVVSVSFPPEPSKRWWIILYSSITLTVLRNLSLNTLGTAFISRLSDHYLLEDAETMEMRSDQMLLTQLSIISSYSSLWYLFTKTIAEDWYWVLCGIVLYQFILLAMDVGFSSYIRPRMISLLKGELIAWFAVGARSTVAFIFPFYQGTEEELPWAQYLRDSFHDHWQHHLLWLLVYSVGPTLLLLLLFARIYKLWSYESIECYGFEETASKKQRNRLMVICALTIGFIVSVTEAIALWADDPTTEKYEGLLNIRY